MAKQMEGEEYVRMLEDYAESLAIALIIDMMRKGIFENVEDEVRLTEKFREDVFKRAENLAKKCDKLEDVMVKATYDAVHAYYGDDLLYEEEEIIPRAEIVLNYIHDDLSRHIEGLMRK